MFIASAVLSCLLTSHVTSTSVTRRLLTAIHKQSYSVYNKAKLYALLDTMPKNVDVKELQGIRLARRQKVRKYPPSTVYLQVLGSGAPGAPKSLYVFTEQARYLFNCGEGSQRLAYEHKVKLGMMEHILVTHKSWSNVGGLPGVLLTLQDTGVPEITLHGPPGIESLYHDTRNFMQFRDLKIKYEHYTNNDGICGQQNDPLTIHSVPLWAKEDSSSLKNDDRISPSENEDKMEDFYAYEKPRLKNSRFRREQYVDPEVRRKKLEESKKCRNLAIAYICRPPPKAGALLLEKCVKAGVPPGPLLGNLKRGEDITLPNGTIVSAKDVTEPDDPGPIFIVVEAPTVDYLDSLLENPAFAKHQSTAMHDEDAAEVVIHFTPPHVMQEPRYQLWMSKFSPSTNHLCLNGNSVCMGSEAVHRIQHKLNHLDTNLFPLLSDQGILVKEPENSTISDADMEKKENSLESCSNGVESEQMAVNENLSKNNDDDGVDSSYVVGPLHQAATLMMYHIRPKKKLDRSSELKLSPATYIEECYAVESFKGALANAKSKMSESRLETGDSSEGFPFVTFLGTGSCIPNKTRNTSGILLNMSADKAILMDCGEGTYGQIVRHFGMSASDELLRQLKAVYVSHLHADHHLGFIRILRARREAFRRSGVESVPKLLLLAPQRIIYYLTSYHVNFENILQDFTLVGNQKFLCSEVRSCNDVYEDACTQLDMKSIDMTYVLHCPSAFGVAWTHNDGWKIAYSGDTMPCHDFVSIGQNCDLLIHEATMEDELEDDARLKTHSTTSQAIQVGCDMNARHIMLTHFSQRYAKVPLLQGTVPENVGIAFDNMKICLQNLPKLHHMYDALVSMFAEHYDDMLEKTAKRAARENLKKLSENGTNERSRSPNERSNSPKTKNMKKQTKDVINVRSSSPNAKRQKKESEDTNNERISSPNAKEQKNKSEDVSSEKNNSPNNADILKKAAA